jgi:hypothetical protein
MKTTMKLRTYRLGLRSESRALALRTHAGVWRAWARLGNRRALSGKFNVSF